MKISIIIPSYNQGRYLEETLRSVIDQKYPALELIVIDGGSTDNSTDIIKKYEKHISYWVSEKDKGQSDAINKGFRRATGEIITWLCSDDLLMPGSLHKVADHFSSLPDEAGLIHGGVVVFKENKDVTTDFGYLAPSLERYISGMAFSQPSAFFKKKYYDRAGGRVSEDLHYGMDHDLFCRMALVCRFYPVNDVLARYRLHDDSKSVTRQNEFIIDWCKTFVNFCRNAGWEKEYEQLCAVSPFREAMNYFHPYGFTFSLPGNTDRKKTLFYHLCYQLRALYAGGNIKAAKKIAHYLKDHYPEPWLDNEKLVPHIRSRLKWPAFMLLLIRKIKGAD